jgi:hypothetical protein
MSSAARGGIEVLTVTCRKGMEIDRAISGHDHRTLVNPFTGRAQLKTGTARTRRMVGATAVAVGLAGCSLWRCGSAATWAERWPSCAKGGRRDPRLVVAPNHLPVPGRALGRPQAVRRGDRGQ